MALERCVRCMAHQMRLVLQGIFERKSLEEARMMFGQRCCWVHAMREQTEELLEPMAQVARMIERHLEKILVHWTRGLMTALVKGLNRLFSAVKCKARRYRSVG